MLRNTDQQVKCCITCKLTKPIERYCLDRGRRRHTCKDCQALQKRELRQANPEHHKLIAKRYRDSHKEECHQRLELWHHKNPNWKKEYQRRYYQEHKQRILAYRKNRWDAGLIHLTTAQRQAARKRYIKKKGILTYTLLCRRWAAKKRTAKQRAAFYDIPIRVMQDLLRLQKRRCAYCQMPLTARFQVDHIVPLSRGGAHSSMNLQITCQACNLHKWATDPIRFAQKIGKLL